MTRDNHDKLKMCNGKKYSRKRPNPKQAKKKSGGGMGTFALSVGFSFIICPIWFWVRWYSSLHQPNAVICLKTRPNPNGRDLFIVYIHSNSVSVKSPPASPVLNVLAGSMSRSLHSSLLDGLCSTPFGITTISPRAKFSVLCLNSI